MERRNLLSDEQFAAQVPTRVEHVGQHANAWPGEPHGALTVSKTNPGGFDLDERAGHPTQGVYAEVKGPTDEYGYPRHLVNTKVPSKDRPTDWQTSDRSGVGAEAFRNQRLFDVRHEPPVVTTLMGTNPRPKGAVSQVLGVAAIESKARWGQYPTPSPDLSQHSAPIVQRLVDKGVVDNPHEYESPDKVQVTNRYNRDVGHEAVEDHAAVFKYVPASRVHKGMLGSQFFKHLTGQVKEPSPAAPKHEQGVLF